MKRFEFELEGVLDHRRHLEEKSKREFALAARVVEEKRQELVALHQAIRSERDGLAQATRGQIDLGNVLTRYRYLGRLHLTIGELHLAIAKGERALEGRRAELVEARRARRVLERLRERRLSEHHAEEERQEQRATDEVAGQVGRRAARAEGQP